MGKINILTDIVFPTIIQGYKFSLKPCPMVTILLYKFGFSKLQIFTKESANL